MPIGKKIVGADWIDDPFLVKAFLDRLDNALDSGVDLDFTWIRTVKENTVKYKRYSLGQDWALKKIEEKIENLQCNRQEDDWIFGTIEDTH
jgi:hypothetical protein